MVIVENKINKTKNPETREIYISDKERVMEEIEHIQLQSPDGTIHPRALVDYARDPNTFLHKYFEWNDTKAAESYRIWQARQLLRVIVIVEPITQKHINAYVSLKSDRDEGGYRLTVDVMSSADKREELLSQALDELRKLERKYNRLVELAPVFEALDKIKE